MNNKGIIFLGDSYTWGQGLNFYGGFEETWFPTQKDGAFYLNKLSNRELDFIKENRFSNLVSKELNKPHIQSKLNGGSQNTMIKFLGSLDLSGYDTLILQMTDIFRDKIFFDYKGNTEMCALSIHQNYVPDEYQTFLDYLYENFDSSIEKFKNYYTNKLVNRFKDIFLELEGNYNIKCFLLTWQDDVIEYIKKDEYLHKRFIKLEYKGIEYDSIFQMATVKNPELTITHDSTLHEMGIKAYDGHISLNAHKIIANSIIKKIKENE